MNSIKSTARRAGVLYFLFMIAAGFAYLTSSITSMVFPAYRHTVFQFMMPLYIGEVPIIFWFLIKGAKVLPLTDY